MPRVMIPGVGEYTFSDKLSRDEIMERATAIQKEALQPAKPEYDARDLGAMDLLKGGFCLINYKDLICKPHQLAHIIRVINVIDKLLNVL